MVTTNRRSKTKKKEEELQIPPIPMEAMEDKKELPEQKEFLEPDHFRKIETMALEMSRNELLMAVEEQALKNISLTIENLQLKLEKQKAVVDNCSRIYSASKIKYTNFKREIFPQYGLKENDRLAYDVNSGKIVRD